MDPWNSESKPFDTVITSFEDNFAPDTSKLSDSAEYIVALERRLAALSSKKNIVEELSAYRADCIERLLRDGCDLGPTNDDQESPLITD